ncbi:MAG: hypothetical protein AAGK78_08095, partial [Planctomycetota bacterium]
MNLAISVSERLRRSPSGGAFDPSNDGDASTSSTDAGPVSPQSQTSDAGVGFPGNLPPATDEPAPKRDLPRGKERSPLHQAWVDTFKQRGAKIGAIWIVLLVLLAVFAPFIANSAPLRVVYTDGTTASPLLQSLTAADWTLLLSFFGVCGLLLAQKVTGFRFGYAIVAMLGVIAAASMFGLLYAEPPENVVFEQHREAMERGEIESVLYTPIPYSPNDRLRDQPGMARTPPTWGIADGDEEFAVAANKPISQYHWLGTTVFGEDMASRMIWATRIALAIGFVATGISTFLGVVVGAVMGYFAGWADLLMMRGIEIVEAVPRLIILLIVTAIIGRKDIFIMMTVIGLVSWTSDARFIR